MTQKIIDKEQALEQLKSELDYLTSFQSGRRLFLQSIPLLLASCATVPQNRYNEGGNNQATSLTIQDEMQMTKEYLPQMQKEYPAIPDSRLQNYINKVGGRIAAGSGNEGHPYHYNFTLVQAPMINAFALPAGTVFVTAPLLAMADSEAELAGVLGHEIGHVKSRHTAERIDQEKKSQSSSLLWGLGGGLIGGALGFGLGKLICRKDDKACLQRIALYGAAAGGAGGLLIQKFGFMAHSREDEMEADRISFRTSVASSYHKDHVGRFYNKLLDMENQAKANGNQASLGLIADAMSTHPPSTERVKQIAELVANEPLKANATINTREFNEAKNLVKQFIKA